MAGARASDHVVMPLLGADALGGHVLLAKVFGLVRGRGRPAAQFFARRWIIGKAVFWPAIGRALSVTGGPGFEVDLLRAPAVPALHGLATLFYAGEPTRRSAGRSVQAISAFGILSEGRAAGERQKGCGGE